MGIFRTLSKRALRGHEDLPEVDAYRCDFGSHRAELQRGRYLSHTT
jgi:hypothetical protein